MTTDSFTPHRDERWTVTALGLAARLRDYEARHPSDAPCLIAALREAEAALNLPAHTLGRTICR